MSLVISAFEAELNYDIHPELSTASGMITLGTWWPSKVHFPGFERQTVNTGSVPTNTRI